MRVISVNRELDGSDMPLCDALEIAVGKGQGKFLSCIGGAPGYLEGEAPNERYIRRRNR